MTELVLFLFSVGGATLMLTHGHIFESAKKTLILSNWVRLVAFWNCPQCVGFWCGFAFGMMIDPVPSVFLPVRMLAYAASGSIAALISAAIVTTK